MPKSILMLDKISKYVFAALFLICLVVNGCTKNSLSSREGTEGVNPGQSQSDIERVEYDAEDVEESDEIETEYETEAVPKTKITVEAGTKDNFTHSNCNPATNKYKDYYVAGGDGYQMLLRFSRPDTLISLVSPNGFYQMAVNVDGEQTPTSSLVMTVGVPQPAYKARNVKFVATWKDGRTSNFYIKYIPDFGLGTIYGSSRYHVNYTRWTKDPSKFNMGMSMGIAQSITSSYIPALLDVIHFSNDHYGVISNAPTSKIVAGKTVWTLKIKERNANCDWRATTKTFKWSQGMKIPSANTSRDSSNLFHRSY